MFQPRRRNHERSVMIDPDHRSPNQLLQCRVRLNKLGRFAYRCAAIQCCTLSQIRACIVAADKGDCTRNIPRIVSRRSDTLLLALDQVGLAVLNHCLLHQAFYMALSVPVDLQVWAYSKLHRLVLCE